MSELISGKEEFDAAYNGAEVFWRWKSLDSNSINEWQIFSDSTSWSLTSLNNNSCEFRLKPSTITLNGVEVPVPFEPKQSEWGVFSIYYLDPDQSDGWNGDEWNEFFDTDLIQFGAWRTEEEIKQVVAALREVFK